MLLIISTGGFLLIFLTGINVDRTITIKLTRGTINKFIKLNIIIVVPGSKPLINIELNIKVKANENNKPNTDTITQYTKPSTKNNLNILFLLPPTALIIPISFFLFIIVTPMKFANVTIANIINKNETTKNTCIYVIFVISKL